MTSMDSLSYDANAKVERWMLAQFRIAYRDWADSEPLGPARAHLLRCPDAVCGSVSGGEGDISEVTAGGVVDLDGEISCPHGESYWYRYQEYDDLPSILEDLDNPKWQQVGPLAELPAYLHIQCASRCGFREFHRIHIGTTTVWARCEHPADLTVVRDGVVVEERQIPPGERYGVVLA